MRDPELEACLMSAPAQASIQRGEETGQEQKVSDQRDGSEHYMKLPGHYENFIFYSVEWEVSGEM